MMLPRPLSEADFSQVEAVFTDVDGTLTSGHQLKSSTIASLEKLRDAGLKRVLVTGRPAGWGECWMRTMPVDAVIVENGALTFLRDAQGEIRKVYAQPEGVRTRNRRRLKAAVAKAMKKVKGARLSMDSAYTEVDLAIDYNESVKLGPAAAGTLERLLTAQKIQAVRSSVHVNCWIGSFDKLRTVKTLISKSWGTDLRPEDPRFVYAGDSFNDAPMFAAFGLSVGVANVQDVLEHLDAMPRFITQQREGAGFEELTRAILDAAPLKRTAP